MKLLSRCSAIAGKEFKTIEEAREFFVNMENFNVLYGEDVELGYIYRNIADKELKIKNNSKVLELLEGTRISTSNQHIQLSTKLKRLKSITLPLKIVYKAGQEITDEFISESLTRLMKQRFKRAGGSLGYIRSKFLTEEGAEVIKAMFEDGNRKDVEAPLVDKKQEHHSLKIADADESTFIMILLAVLLEDLHIKFKETARFNETNKIILDTLIRPYTSDEGYKVVEGVDPTEISYEYMSETSLKNLTPEEIRNISMNLHDQVQYLIYNSTINNVNIATTVLAHFKEAAVKVLLKNPKKLEKGLEEAKLKRVGTGVK